MHTVRCSVKLQGVKTQNKAVYEWLLEASPQNLAKKEDWEKSLGGRGWICFVEFLKVYDMCIPQKSDY